MANKDIDEVNLGIRRCKNGTKERNAIMLSTEVTFAYEYGHVPYPYEILKYLDLKNNGSIIRL